MTRPRSVFKSNQQPDAVDPTRDNDARRDGDSSLSDAGATSYEALRGRRMLLVDDNLFNRQLALQLLSDVGVLVTAAENGRQALDLLTAPNAADFDLVLMDCRMPVMDGFEATRLIRADARWRTVPIIAMTASALAEEHQEAREAGMNDELVKPIDMATLYRTLLRWIDHRDRQRLAGGANAAATTLTSLPGIDSRLGLARAMNDEVLFERLLRLFARMHGNFDSAFREMTASGDQAGRLRLAHDLKSSAGTLGAQALQQVAMTLERACYERIAETAVDERLAAVLRELTPVLAGIQALPPSTRA